MRSDLMEKYLNGNTIYIFEKECSLSFKLAQHLIELLNHFIKQKGVAVFQVSSGGSPQSLYRLLVSTFSDSVDWDKVVFVQMDEYVGLDKAHPASQYRLLNDSLMKHLMCRELIILDEHFIADPYSYDERMKQLGGIDISLQGIGTNAHLAFNEPGSAIDSPTRIVELHESTRAANSRFFETLADVPDTAITCGMKTILESKHIFLLSLGATKANAIKQALLGPIDINIPASLLRTRTDVRYYMDIESASLVQDKL